MLSHTEEKDNDENLY